jgi:hypothetical protein
MPDDDNEVSHSSTAMSIDNVNEIDTLELME